MVDIGTMIAFTRTGNEQSQLKVQDITAQNSLKQITFLITVTE